MSDQSTNVMGWITMLGLLNLILTSASARGDDSLVIGGFDAARGGCLSIESGSLISGLRVLITSEFPDIAISGNKELTEAYLATIDILFIGSLTCEGASCDITPLSDTEQQAVLAFVESGGTALIFSENTDFAPANQSLLDPFGVVVAGRLIGLQTVIVGEPCAHEVTCGAFGLEAIPEPV